MPLLWLFRRSSFPTIATSMAAWLDTAQGSSGWTLTDTGRLEALVHWMSHPDTQYPALICFAGNGNRVRALRALFPRNNVTRRGPAALMRLHLSTETAETDHPVLFAECGIYNSSSFADPALYRGSDQKLRQYSVSQRTSRSAADVNLHVMSQVVLPWTQILCLFVDSVSEMRELQRLLDQPLHKIHMGSHSVNVRFRILIVLTTPQDYASHELAAAVPQDHSRDAVAPEVTFVDLRDRYELSPMAAFEPLRGVILDKLQSVRTEQTQHRVLFSAVHLSALWKSNLESQMRRLDPAAFDCLRVARRNYPSTLGRKACLVEFLRQAQQTGCEAQDISSFVASAILMDAYPPGMHCESTHSPTSSTLPRSFRSLHVSGFFFGFLG